MARLFRDARIRAWIFQAFLICGLALAVGTAIHNALTALDARGIATGLGFLSERAGFDLSESIIPYGPQNSFLRAFLAGLANTIAVSVAAIVLATTLGVLVGLARLSPNLLLARLARGYVELFRNTPQLVQIIFWYALLIALPRVRNALDLGGGFFLSNRGLNFPWIAQPIPGGVASAVIGIGFFAIVIVLCLPGRKRWRGRAMAAIALSSIAALIGCFLFGGVSTPALKGFSFSGGAVLSPEFIALFLGLSLYIAAFIAEIVRAGLAGVDRGQIEAAEALGLSQGRVLTSVRIPQALRIIVPPATAQYISLVKNSSLGVAIGYPELFNVSNSISTLSGQAIECMTIMGLLYLSTALAMSAAANAFNRFVQVTER
ncbi:amino acid ABC transporter permease [Paralimibaculum aggregatum]|uniref:Amino acid ABC transporter permease n=1 Tax=Paralimibaculum aggregatum TaxID=3036245 RepID=A0ABQ6LT00_9RHOB|nr:ABC transporter permease subunit [Limibaculum sp. NKW23]GMG85197.1 amino acid ABC transporter permease [Limibaculum sp. NKW23]